MLLIPPVWSERRPRCDGPVSRREGEGVRFVIFVAAQALAPSSEFVSAFFARRVGVAAGGSFSRKSVVSVRLGRWLGRGSFLHFLTAFVGLFCRRETLLGLQSG